MFFLFSKSILKLGLINRILKMDWIDSVLEELGMVLNLILNFICFGLMCVKIKTAGKHNLKSSIDEINLCSAVYIGTTPSFTSSSNYYWNNF